MRVSVNFSDACQCARVKRCESGAAGEGVYASMRVPPWHQWGCVCTLKALVPAGGWRRNPAFAQAGRAAAELGLAVWARRASSRVCSHS